MWGSFIKPTGESKSKQNTLIMALLLICYMMYNCKVVPFAREFVYRLGRFIGFFVLFLGSLASVFNSCSFFLLVDVNSQFLCQSHLYASSVASIWHSRRRT